MHDNRSHAVFILPCIAFFAGYFQRDFLVVVHFVRQFSPNVVASIVFEMLDHQYEIRWAFGDTQFALAIAQCLALFARILVVVHKLLGDKIVVQQLLCAVLGFIGIIALVGEGQWQLVEVIDGFAFVGALQAGVRDGRLAGECSLHKRVGYNNGGLFEWRRR